MVKFEDGRLVGSSFGFFLVLEFCAVMPSLIINDSVICVVRVEVFSVLHLIWKCPSEM